MNAHMIFYTPKTYLIALQFSFYSPLELLTRSLYYRKTLRSRRYSACPSSMLNFEKYPSFSQVIRFPCFRMDHGNHSHIRDIYVAPIAFLKWKRAQSHEQPHTQDCSRGHHRSFSCCTLDNPERHCVHLVYMNSANLGQGTAYAITSWWKTSSGTMFYTAVKFPAL